jgi:excisionase family DNA binding protein
MNLEETIKRAIEEALREAAPIPEYMNTIEAARYLGVSKQFLEIARHRGGGPKFLKISSRMVRYKKSDLDEWMCSHRRESTSDITN